MQRRSAITLWIAFVCLVFTPSATHPQPQPGRADNPVPRLPLGKLIYVSSGGNFYNFVIEASTSHNGSVVDTWIYQVIDPPMPLGTNTIVQSIDHLSIDCVARTRVPLAAWFYDERGSEVDSIGRRPTVKLASGALQDAESRYVCTGERVVSGETIGWPSALDAIRKTVQGGN